MKPFDGEAAGQRIARARRRRGLSQVVLAGLVGRSESWLSQVERGKRGIDSHSVLSRLAEILRVDVAEIAGPEPGSGDAQHAYPAAPLIEQAMLGYGTPGQSAPEQSRRHTQISHLRARAHSAYQAYQATRYDATGRLLPGLIRDIEAASHVTAPGTPAICEVRAMVYDTAAALLNRVGEPFLAWATADRAMSAAAYSGEPLLAAVGVWRLSYIVTSRKHPQEALDLAMSAAGALEHVMRSPSPGQLSVYGALHLAAATAAAATQDREMTAALLATARRIADRTGDSNHMGTAFGHVNVSIHAISASLRLGDPKAAVQAGEALDTTSIPAGLVGRRTQVNLDLAHAYAMRRQDAAAVNLLLAAERLSPQLVRYDPGHPGSPHRSAPPGAPAINAGTAPSRASRRSCLTRTFVRVSGPHSAATYAPSHRSDPSLMPLLSLITGHSPVHAEEAISDGATSKNWCRSSARPAMALAGGVSGHGCSRALDRAAPGQRPDADSQQPRGVARTDHRGLRGAARPARHRTARQRMTGTHEPPPRLRAQVQAAALRAAFPQYAVNVLQRRGDQPRFEVVSRDGGNPYCLISTDALEIWRELQKI